MEAYLIVCLLIGWFSVSLFRSLSCLSLFLFVMISLADLFVFVGCLVVFIRLCSILSLFSYTRLPTSVFMSLLAHDCVLPGSFLPSSRSLGGIIKTLIGTKQLSLPLSLYFCFRFSLFLSLFSGVIMTIALTIENLFLGISTSLILTKRHVPLPLGLAISALLPLSIMVGSVLGASILSSLSPTSWAYVVSVSLP